MDVRTFADTPIGPAHAPYAVTPSDDEPLPVIPRCLYIGTGGDVTLRGVGAGEDVTYRNIPDAGFIYVAAEFVRATGTTAGDIIAEA